MRRVITRERALALALIVGLGGCERVARLLESEPARRTREIVERGEDRDGASAALLARVGVPDVHGLTPLGPASRLLVVDGEIWIDDGPALRGLGDPAQLAAGGLVATAPRSVAPASTLEAGPLSIPALSAAARAARHEDERPASADPIDTVLLAVPRDARYGALARLVLAASESGYRSVDLAVEHGVLPITLASTRVVVETVPTLGAITSEGSLAALLEGADPTIVPLDPAPAPASPAEQLGLDAVGSPVGIFVHLRGDGISIHVPRGYVDATCVAIDPLAGAALPTRADDATLDRCFEALARTAADASSAIVVVSATDGSSVTDVARTIAAVEGTRGARRFSTVELALEPAPPSAPE